MKIIPYRIAGLFLIDIDPLTDARGMFARTYCEREFLAAGLETNWVQMNVSFNKSLGTLRGFHFQTGEHADAKLVSCIRGKACDVALDLRQGSVTFGCHAIVDLECERRNALYIPPGFAHGFQTLVDRTELQYLHSEFYAPESEGGVNALDPELELSWPLPVSERSDRDVNLPPLAKLTPL